MYSAENILWIKNVLRNKGAEWAYEDVSCDGTFLLNWPSSKRGSAGRAAVGDIIVLFQKIKRINNKRNYHVHLTHLVSPVSADIEIDPNSPSHQWCRRVKLIAKADPIHTIPNPGYFSFFLPNRGLTNPIINLENNINLTEAETKDRVWQLFQEYICPDVRPEIYTPPNPIGVYGEREGDTVVRGHILYEQTIRNSAIVQQAKALALRAGNGRVFCECCNFDFLAAYGLIGTGFIECHHKMHIAQGARLTTLADLALVCSNCHRMLHRKLENGLYHTVETLRAIIPMTYQRPPMPL